MAFLTPMSVASLRGLGRQIQKSFSRIGIGTVTHLRDVPLRPWYCQLNVIQTTQPIYGFIPFQLGHNLGTSGICQ